MLLSDLIGGFLLDCKARRLSPNTITRCYAPQLCELCNALGDPDVTTITPDDLRQFVADLTQRVKSGWTVRGYVRTIKRLFNWATAEGILADFNPADKLRYPKTPQRKIEIFSKSDIERLLVEARDVSFRNYAIVLLFLDSGLRRGELLALELEDVNVLTGVVTVRHGKGGKSRQVRVGNVCRKALWRYVAEFRQAEPGVNSFFVNRWGKPMSHTALTQMLRRLGKRTGLHVYAHKFRHTFATLYAQRVPSAILLADALGHSSVEMSRRYVHLAQTQSTDIAPSPMNGILREGS